MPGLIINGKSYEVPGLKILNWNDDQRLRRAPEDGSKRETSWVRNVIIHTTRGIPGGKIQIPQSIIPGGEDGGHEVRINKFWSTDPKQSGAHIIIDSDGSIGCLADLQTEKTYHAGNRTINDTSIGIEIFQRGDGGIYEASLDACVKLCEFLCSHFGIQRQVHWPYKKGPVSRLSKEGKTCVGVFGHRDVSSNRGLGDPGDFIMQRLMAVGYEAFDLSKDEDFQAWKTRQSNLGLSADGIPGPSTVEALKKAGYFDGLWTLGKAVVDSTPPLATPAPPAQPVVEALPKVDAETGRGMQKLLNWILSLFRKNA